MVVAESHRGERCEGVVHHDDSVASVGVVAELISVIKGNLEVAILSNVLGCSAPLVVVLVSQIAVDEEENSKEVANVEDDNYQEHDPQEAPNFDKVSDIVVVLEGVFSDLRIVLDKVLGSILRYFLDPLHDQVHVEDLEADEESQHFYEVEETLVASQA